jgi:hypothetical protein
MPFSSCSHPCRSLMAGVAMNSYVAPPIAKAKGPNRAMSVGFLTRVTQDQLVIFESTRRSAGVQTSLNRLMKRRISRAFDKALPKPK